MANRRGRSWLAPVTAGLTVAALAGSANAGGDYSFRTVTQSSVEDCPSGRQVELFHNYANVYSWDEDVAIACLTGTGRASWVLVSSTLCDDEESATGERYCSGKEAAAAHVPALARDPDVAGKSPPYTMNYQLLRWGVGRDCTIEHQAFDFSKSAEDNSYFWHCAHLTFGSTLTGTDPTSPIKYHPFEIWTKSNEPLKVTDSDDPTAQVPLAFPVGEETYTYRFR